MFGLAIGYTFIFLHTIDNVNLISQSTISTLQILDLECDLSLGSNPTLKKPLMHRKFTNKNIQLNLLIKRIYLMLWIIMIIHHTVLQQNIRGQEETKKV